MSSRVRTVNESAGLGIGENVVDAFIYLLAVWTASGRTATGYERHAYQPAYGNIAPRQPRAKRTVFMLLFDQPAQSPLNTLFHSGREPAASGFFLIDFLPPGSHRCNKAE